MITSILIYIITWFQFPVANSTFIISSEKSPERPSITFILGEDEDDSEPYFDLAKQYYLANPTNYFVDDCRSLDCMRARLINQLPVGTPGWGQINIVLHSNQWTGMSVPVTSDSEIERTTVAILLEAIQDQQLAALPDAILNEQSIMEFKACGLGSNPELLEAIQLAFGGFDEVRPQVKASQHFIYYGRDEYGQLQSKEYRPYYAFYRTAYKPADLHLVRQFKNSYPDIRLDWLAALQREYATPDGATFRVRFNVPIVWRVPKTEEITSKSWSTPQDQVAFVRQQPDLMKALRKFNIPEKQFRWTIKADGADILIKGKATVVCVLEAVRQYQ